MSDGPKWNRHDIPDDTQFHVGVVMGNDVARAAHFSKWQTGHCAPGFFIQVRSRFADDFDFADHGVLLLRVCEKSRLLRIAYISGDQPGGLELFYRSLTGREIRLARMVTKKDTTAASANRSARE